MKILVCLGVTTTRGAVLIGCSIRKVENPCSRVSGITDWQMVMAERREDQAKPFGSWCQTQALLPSFGAPPHKDACQGGALSHPRDFRKTERSTYGVRRKEQ